MTSDARTSGFVVAGLTLLALSSVPSQAAPMNPHCTEVGGMAMTNIGGFGSPNTTLGVVTGDLRGAIGVEILGMRNDSSGKTVITVQHHWVTETGETLQIDTASAAGVFIAPGLFAIADYKIHLSGGTGRFENASGDMSAIGELDLNAGHAVLRYSGQLCSAGPAKP